MGKKRKNRQQEEKKVNRNIKKLICSGLAFCQIVSMTLMTAYARPDWPSDVGIQAEAGTVMDVDSGTVIFRMVSTLRSTVRTARQRFSRACISGSASPRIRHLS